MNKEYIIGRDEYGINDCGRERRKKYLEELYRFPSKFSDDREVQRLISNEPKHLYQKIKVIVTDEELERFRDDAFMEHG